MRSGYTLIELLVVISILALMTVLGFISYGSFAKDRAADKALIEVQTILRLAQGNATSSTLCNVQPAANWKVVILSGDNLELHCDPEDISHRTYKLQNAEISEIMPSCGSAVGLPLTVIYSSGNAALSFSYTGASQNCLASEYWTFTINSDATKRFKLSRGGAIDVE